MTAKPTVKVVDRGMDLIEKRVRDVERLKPRAVVGVQGEQGQEIREEGMTNAYLASIHEFGTLDKRIPERSFMRSTFDDNLSKYDKAVIRVSKIFFSAKPFPAGGKLDGQLLLIGERYRADIIKRIKSKIPPPLALSTIRRRASKTDKAGGAGLSDLPLWHTGSMINSISVEIQTGPKTNAD
jgi:hypothetical protein